MHDILDYVDQLMADSTPDKPVWNKEKINSTGPNKWSYIDGVMMLAFVKVYEVTGQQKYLDFARDFIDSYFNEEGQITGYEITEFNCDSINEAKVLLYLHELSPNAKYDKALQDFKKQLIWQPQTTQGSYWHKLIYPYQIWLDGLYMVNPFKLKLAVLEDDQTAIEQVLHTFENADLLKDDKTGLYYHGYDDSKLLFWADKETGLSQNFWLRSIGWLLMSMIDCIEILGTSDERVAPLKRQFKHAMNAIVSYIDLDTHLYYKVVDKAGQIGNYLETSGSAAIAYAMMKGARLEVLDGTYFETGSKTLESLHRLKFQHQDGQFSLNDICLVAGLGGMPGKGDYELRDGSYEYYISEPIVSDDAKGIGPFIYAYTEYLRGGL
jgi:unsaturated rhamnogalacturonyl hydrolase